MLFPLADPAYRVLVARLVVLRREPGLTQRALAARLGRHQSYVAKSERCERRLDPAEFCAFVLALGGDPVAEFARVSASLDEG